jgi:hypothetical protein
MKPWLANGQFHWGSRLHDGMVQAMQQAIHPAR